MQYIEAEHVLNLHEYSPPVIYTSETTAPCSQNYTSEKSIRTEGTDGPNRIIGRLTLLLTTE